MKKYDNIYSFIKDYEEKVGGYYFYYNTLKFFGERVSEMRILKNTVKITDNMDKKRECYILSSLQRNHPSGARRSYSYFDCETLERVFIKE
jgi:hypothetical protein